MGRWKYTRAFSVAMATQELKNSHKQLEVSYHRIKHEYSDQMDSAKAKAVMDRIVAAYKQIDAALIEIKTHNQQETDNEKK